MDGLELEALVLKLVGDASEYKKMMDDAEKWAQQASDRIAKAATEAEKKANAAVAAHTRLLSEAAKVTEAVATPQERYNAQVKQLDKFLKDGLISHKTYNRAMAEAETILPSVAAKQEKLNKDLEFANRITSAVATAEENYKMKLQQLDSVLKQNFITQETYNRSLKELNSTLPSVIAKQEAHKKLMQSMQQGTMLAAQGIQSLGHSITNMGMSLTAGVTLPIAAAAAAATKFGSDFQVGMSELQSAAKPTEEELQRIQAVALQLSKDLKMRPTEIIAGFTELLKAGVPLEEVLNRSGAAALRFAKVGKLDVATAATIMADSLTVFGEKSEKTVNILTSGADASSISIKQMAEAFSQASAVSGQAHQTLNDTAAAIAILGKNGIKGTDAGTSLKTMLLRMMAPADKAAAVIKKYGLELRGATGQMKPFSELVGELENKMGKLDQETRDNALFDLFGQDAIRAAGVFIKTGVEGFGAMTTAMSETLSVTEKYAIITNNLQGKWGALTATLERWGIAVFPVLEPVLSSVVDWIIKAVDATSAWILANPELAQQAAILLAIAAAVGPVVTMVGMAVTAFGGLVATIAGFVALGPEVLGIALLIAGGLGLVIEIGGAVVAAVAAIVYSLIGADGLSYAWDYVLTTATSFFMGVMGFLFNFQENITRTSAWFVKDWDQAINNVINLFFGFVQTGINNVMVMVRMFTRLFAAFLGWLVGRFEHVFTKEFAMWAAQGVIKVMGIFNNFANRAWETIQSIFTGRKVDLSDFIRQMGLDFASGMQNENFLETASNIMKDEAKNLQNPLENMKWAGGPGLKLDMGVKGMDEMDKTLSKAQETMDGTATATDKVTEALAGMGKASEESSKEIMKMMKKMKEEEATVGMNAHQKIAWRLKNAEGATVEQQAEADRWAAEMTKHDDEKKAVKAAATLKDKMAKQAAAAAAKHLSPLEKRKKEETELKDLLDKELISEEAYAYGLKEIEKDFKKATDAKIKFHAGGAHGMDALEAGSQEAMKALVSFRGLRNPAADDAAKMAEVVKNVGAPDLSRLDVGKIALDKPNPFMADAGAGSKAGDTAGFTGENKVIEDLLKQVANNTGFLLEEIKDKPNVTLEPANL